MRQLFSVQSLYLTLKSSFKVGSPSGSALYICTEMQTANQNAPIKILKPVVRKVYKRYLICSVSPWVPCLRLRLPKCYINLDSMYKSDKSRWSGRPLGVCWANRGTLAPCMKFIPQLQSLKKQQDLTFWAVDLRSQECWMFGRIIKSQIELNVKCSWRKLNYMKLTFV